MKQILLTTTTLIFLFISLKGQDGLRNQKIDGYRGIWFELNQKYEYGDKYSGGLGTYTAKHIPLAIYAAEVDKTFFVYGGTTQQEEKHLLCMVGVFDHKTRKVSKPTVAYDKLGVDDPHDNPSIMIDDSGYIWIFVSGRGRKRTGIKLKSTLPYNIDSFEIISEEEFTYPQIRNTSKGFFHFFTKYTGVRELYFEHSKDGSDWSSDQKLAGIKAPGYQKSGHYQLSNQYNDGEILATFFNRHIDGHPDTRTDLYYVQTRDFGQTWTNIAGVELSLPLETVDNDARVIDYFSAQKNVYMKDMDFDAEGNPVCLIITSGGHEPGPQNAPYEWSVVFWSGEKWINTVICESDHNYDMGSIFISGDSWKVVGPTENPPQKYGVGGEIAIWTSEDKGNSWRKEKVITHSSAINHAYVRRPVNAKAPFSYFWASGNPDSLSISELYFGDFEGNVWKLPYTMKKAMEKPVEVK